MAKAKERSGAEAEGDGEVGFDGRLEELERIVAELEGGGLALEEAIERYAKGVDLLRRCHRSLGEYRRRVEELTKDAEAALVPFDGDPDVRPNGPNGG